MSETTISEQVLANSDVIEFEVYSTELVSSYRSIPQEVLVTFEVSLTASEDTNIVEKLSEIFAKIDHFQPDSIVVTDQSSYSEDGKFSKLSVRISIQNSDVRFDALDTKVDAISNDLASNLTEINTSLEFLESQTNVTVTADVSKLEQKFDELESKQLPALKKDRIEYRIVF